MKIYTCVLSVILGLIVDTAFSAHLFEGRHGFPSYEPGTGFADGFLPTRSVGNLRVRRQSPPMGRFQSPRVRLSRFSGFDTRSRMSPFRGLMQRNPFTTRQIGGLRSSLFRSQPFMSEFSRPNPSRLFQSSRPTRRLSNPASAPFSMRGGLRSFGGSIGRPSRLRTLSRGQGLSSINRQLQQQLSRGYTGTGTRDDPIRIRASHTSSRQAPTSLRGVSQRARTSGRRVQTHGVNPSVGSGPDQGVIALFGFDETAGGGIGTLGIPMLSETVDKSVGIKRTPIKKSETKTSIGAKTESDKSGQTSEQATIQQIERIVRKSAASVMQSEVVGISEVVAETPAKVVEEVPVELVSAKAVELVAEIPAETVSGTHAEEVANIPTEIISGSPVEVFAEVPTEKVLSTQAEIVAEIPIEVVSGTPVELVAEIPSVSGSHLEVIADIPTAAVVEVPSEVVSGTPGDVVADPGIIVGATITDADTVNININANVTANNTGIIESPVAIETALPSKTVTTLNLAEPVAVYVEGHAVADAHHASSGIEQATAKHSEEVAPIDVAVVVDAAPVEAAVIPAITKHDVGGVSVIADSITAHATEVGTVSEAAITDASVKVAAKIEVGTANEITNSNNVNINDINVF